MLVKVGKDTYRLWFQYNGQFTIVTLQDPETGESTENKVRRKHDEAENRLTARKWALKKLLAGFPREDRKVIYAQLKRQVKWYPGQVLEPKPALAMETL